MKPISNMAFYCCGARMDDAEMPQPICGDAYAKLFMNEDGRRIYAKFGQESLSRVSMTVRHRIIDQLVHRMLSTTDDLCLVTIGAGFDSRPYRLSGGTWFELDEPQLIAYKNSHLPPSRCPNPLERIPIDFAADTLEEKLARIPRDKPVVFILEGVFIYLTENDTRKLIRTLNILFPAHLLVCDLVSRDMVEKYGQQLRSIAAQMKADFKAIDRPERLFSGSGYQLKEKISLVEVCVDLGLYALPKYFLKYFLKNEVDGNAVCVWQRPRPRALAA